jgi:hypothetical protein
MAGTARPTGRELAVEVRNVIQDLPLLLTAPLYRRWHLRWGATPAEVANPLPGDDLMPGAQYQSTRAISIDASPEAVWPWLVQVGCLRAGWYSNDLLDNLAYPSATVIVPELQHIEVGGWVPMSPKPSARSGLEVHSFEANRWLLWTTPDSTWAWQLTPTAHGTRLVARINARYDWRHPHWALLGVMMMEFGDFAMLRRMLRGIKTRAEALEHDLSQPMVIPAAVGTPGAS